MGKNEYSNIDIDELLNGFVDEELDARQQTEVQRMVKRDKKIAERLQKIMNCRRLVSSLPYAEAPQGTLENIKAAIEKKPLPVQRTRQSDQREGARHLMFRRLTAAAAMFALVAVLAALIYSIVATEPHEEQFAAEKWQQPTPEVTAAAVKTDFRGKLLLQTETPSEVVAFIDGALERNIISATIDGPRQSHTLICSRQKFNSLMTELADIWDKFDSATLFIETGRAEGQVVVAAVVPEQIIEIANQDKLETQIKAAQYFAALNNMNEHVPGKEVLLAIEGNTPDLLTIPKPVLTSSEKPAKKAADTEEQNVLLTIIVTGSE